MSFFDVLSGRSKIIFVASQSRWFHRPRIWYTEEDDKTVSLVDESTLISQIFSDRFI